MRPSGWKYKLPAGLRQRDGIAVAGPAGIAVGAGQHAVAVAGRIVAGLAQPQLADGQCDADQAPMALRQGSRLQQPGQQLIAPARAAQRKHSVKPGQCHGRQHTHQDHHGDQFDQREAAPGSQPTPRGWQARRRPSFRRSRAHARSCVIQGCRCRSWRAPPGRGRCSPHSCRSVHAARVWPRRCWLDGWLGRTGRRCCCPD